MSSSFLFHGQAGGEEREEELRTPGEVDQSASWDPRLRSPLPGELKKIDKQQTTHGFSRGTNQTHS